MDTYPIVIIGGGAAGLMLASLLPSALLIEKNPILGKKLLVSGGGQCNVTHDETNREFVTHYYEKKNYVSPAIYGFGPEGVRKYLASLGVETFAREDGKVFPTSLSSATVRDALENKAGTIWTGTEVKGMKKTENGFLLDLGEREIGAKTLVLATGGTVCPQSGSTGDGLRFASSLGHRIVPVTNALSGIRTKEDVSALEGIALENAELTVAGHRAEGPLLFTRKGISGPLAQNLSRYCTGETEIKLKMTEVTAEEIKRQNGKLKASNALHNLTGLPYRLLENFVPGSGKIVAELTKNDLKTIVERLTEWKTRGTTRGEEKSAMVTCGGVDTREVDGKTFRSKLVEGLYIIGETLDVDGECGGYNITFAFSSAYLAAQSIRENF